MQLTAHTNAVGRYTQQSTYLRQQVGWTYFGVRDDFDRTFGQSLDSAYSGKPPLVRGDRKSIYPYDRQVARVVENIPYKIRTHWMNPGGIEGGSYDYTTEYYFGERHHIGDFWPYSEEVVENAYSEAKVKALNKLAGAKAEVGVELAQLRMTMDMLGGAAKSAADFLLALKRGNAGYFRNLFGGSPSKTAADLWLQYQYGWKPLAQSVHDISEVLFKKIEEKPLKATGTGTVSREGAFDYGNTRQKWKYTAEVKCFLEARIQDAEAFSRERMGLANPLTIAWELVPWSFAVDWFVPIGDVLAATSATSGLTFSRGALTRRVRSSVEITHRDDVDLGVWDELVEPGKYREEQFTFDRDPLTSFPSPVFFADETPLSTTRTLNALALIRQLL